MSRFKVIKVGHPFNADVLMRTRTRRTPDPWSIEVVKLLNEIAVGPESLVYPMSIGDKKKATARAAVLRLIRQNGLPIYVSVNSTYPDTLLLSRTPIGRNIHKD